MDLRRKATDITVDDGRYHYRWWRGFGCGNRYRSRIWKWCRWNYKHRGNRRWWNCYWFAGAEDENIVLYAEIEKYPSYQPLSDEEYTPVNEIVTANEDIVICNGDGFKVGYIKNGATISVTEYSSIAWARFENPIKGTDYDYLYVLKDYIAVPDANQFTVTESDIKQKIIDDIKNLDVTDYIFVDTPSNDMEVFEFRIESVFKDEIDFNYWYSQCTEGK